MKFVPPTVSRWYRFDWQYAVDVTRIPLLRPASVVIAVMPLMISSEALLSNLGWSMQFSLWAFWIASVSFVLATVILYKACPKLILEFRDYSQFKERGNSHRWIVWEFYNNVSSLSGWESLVQETLAKKVSCKSDATFDAIIDPLCPEFAGPLDKNVVRVFKPLNIDRDIYLPLHCYGEKLVLSMREADTELEAKQKELFWILYSHAAKESPCLRVTFWILVGLSTILVAANIAKNIALVFVQLKA